MENRDDGSQVGYILRNGIMAWLRVYITEILLGLNDGYISGDCNNKFVRGIG
jgi:hypothetical protein